MTNKNVKNLILGSIAFVITASVAGITNVYAYECETLYGGGEKCIVNKRFEIDKDVRIEGDNEWKDKVTDVEKDEIVEFKIKIKNRSDEEADEFDDMKMEDFLPDEMEKVGGSGLTEEWDNFEPGESKTFIIKAVVKDSEYDRDTEFEKCVVNKAEVRWDDNFEGSDTATVCYGNVEASELPKTGAESVLGLAGLTSLALGLLIKKFNK